MLAGGDAQLADRLVAELAEHRQFVVDLLEPGRDHLEQVFARYRRRDAAGRARQERDSSFEPALKTRVSNMGAYDTLYLGFPIWGETAPPVIRSFLKAHDLSGKTLIPFVTHGGYGLGNSRSILASHAPKAQLRRDFSMEADQERQTMNRVKSWLGEIDSNG